LSVSSNQTDENLQDEDLQKVSVIETIETICSSIDLLLIAFDKLAKWVKETYIYHPETANRLLGEIAFLDDILTCIKNNADKIKEKAEIEPEISNPNKTAVEQP
jgi:hypothetical protein